MCQRGTYHIDPASQEFLLLIAGLDPHHGSIVAWTVLRFWRDLLMPSLNISFPLGKPGLDQVLDNERSYAKTRTCWEYITSMGKTQQGEFLEEQHE